MLIKVYKGLVRLGGLPACLAFFAFGLCDFKTLDQLIKIPLRVWVNGSWEIRFLGWWLFRLFRDQVFLHLGALEIGKKVEHLELKLVFRIQVAPWTVDTRNFKKVNCEHAVDNFQRNCWGEVFLLQLYVSLLVFQEKKSQKRDVIRQFFYLNYVI